MEPVVCPDDDPSALTDEDAKIVMRQYEQLAELMLEKYREGEQTGVEGCLSFPGKSGIVKRPARVTVEALDRTGKKCRYRGDGLLARCFCHELDHLDGVLYIDKAERMLTQDEIEEMYGEDD